MLAANKNQAEEKSLRPEKIRRMIKPLRPEKIRRMIKSLRPEKVRWMIKSLRLEKVRWMTKSLRGLKSPHPVKFPRLWKYWSNWKSKRPAYCLGSAEYPTADFSLVPLMSKFSSSLMWWISHVVSKWGTSCCRPAFMGGIFPVLYQLFVPAVCTGLPCQETAQIHAATKSLGSTDSCQITIISNSAYKCPITEPKKRG